MLRPRGPDRPWLVTRLLALVLGSATAGALLGVLEGAVYPSEEGPRIPLAAYWGILAAALFVGSLAFARLVEPVLPLAVLHALALLPLAVVVQDAASLHLQGMQPWATDWYAEVFGRTILTARLWGLPGFYVWFTAASLAATALLLAARRHLSAALGLRGRGRRPRRLASFDLVGRGQSAPNGRRAPHGRLAGHGSRAAPPAGSAGPATPAGPATRSP